MIERQIKRIDDYIASGETVPHSEILTLYIFDCLLCNKGSRFLFFLIRCEHITFTYVTVYYFRLFQKVFELR